MTYRSTGKSPVQAQVANVIRRYLGQVRRPRTTQEWIAAAVVGVIVALFAAQLLWAAGRFMIREWWTIPILAVAVFLIVRTIMQVRAERASDAAMRLQALRFTLEELDALTPTEFEYAVRDLMIRDEIDAHQVGGRGDQAADVIGRDPRTGNVIVAQCKHTTVAGKVGAQVIYQVNGTAGPSHGADVAVVVTNGGFTKDAQERAAAFRIALVDRASLERWANQGVNLPTLLGLNSKIRGRRHQLRHRF